VRCEGIESGLYWANELSLGGRESKLEQRHECMAVSESRLSEKMKVHGDN
jgi:hypothetical protein